VSHEKPKHGYCDDPEQDAEGDPTFSPLPAHDSKQEGRSEQSKRAADQAAKGAVSSPGLALHARHVPPVISA
jgi:hypothetical protein